MTGELYNQDKTIFIQMVTPCSNIVCGTTVHYSLQKRAHIVLIVTMATQMSWPSGQTTNCSLIWDIWLVVMGMLLKLGPSFPMSILWPPDLSHMMNELTVPVFTTLPLLRVLLLYRKPTNKTWGRTGNEILKQEWCFHWHRDTLASFTTLPTSGKRIRIRG